MNWNQLDYFLRAYQTRSFTAAAKQIPMSAQGLAKSVHSLESELGVPLFTSGEQGTLVPTPYAEQFETFALECMESWKKFSDTISGIDASPRESIKLYAALGSFSILGLEFIPDFRRDNPNVDIDVIDLPDLMAEEAMLAGSDALGLTVLPTLPQFETIELTTVDRCVWVHKDDPLATKRQVCVKDLQDRSIAMVGRSFKNYGLLQERLKAEGVTPTQIVTSAEMHWLHEFAHKGRGVAFTAESVLPMFEQDTTVVAIPFKDMPYTIGISWHKDHQLTNAERALVDACVARVRPTMRKRLRDLFHLG